VNDIEIVRLILSFRKPDGTSCINPTDEDDCWAIQEVCENEDTEILRLLLEDGQIDPTTDDNRAIREACWEDHIEVVQLLLEDGRADPEAGLEAAREVNNTELVEFIEGFMID